MTRERRAIERRLARKRAAAGARMLAQLGRSALERVGDAPPRGGAGLATARERSRHAPEPVRVTAPQAPLWPAPQATARLGPDCGKGSSKHIQGGASRLPRTGAVTPIGAGRGALRRVLVTRGASPGEARDAVAQLDGGRPDRTAMLPRRVDWRWRDETASALRRHGHDRAARQVEGCRTWGGVALTRSLRMMGVPWHCGSRTCRTCQPHRTAGTRARLDHALRDAVARGAARQLSFLTVTIPGAWHAGLFRLGYRVLTRALAVFQRLSEYRARVTGAMVAIEHPWSVTSGRWHWHAHTVAECAYWPVRATCGRDGLCASCERQRARSAAVLEAGADGRRALWHRTRLDTARGGCGAAYGYRDTWEWALQVAVEDPRWTDDQRATLAEIGCDMRAGFVYADIRAHRVARALRELAQGDAQGREDAIRSAVEESCSYALKGDAIPADALIAYHVGSSRIQRYRWVGTWRGRDLPQRAPEDRPVMLRLGSVQLWASGARDYALDLAGRRVRLPVPLERRRAMLARASEGAALAELSALWRVVRLRRRIAGRAARARARARAGPSLTARARAG